MPAFLSIRIYGIDWLDRKMLLHVPGLAAQHQRGGQTAFPRFNHLSFLSHCHLFQLPTTVLLSTEATTWHVYVLVLVIICCTWIR